MKHISDYISLTRNFIFFWNKPATKQLYISFNIKRVFNKFGYTKLNAIKHIDICAGWDYTFLGFLIGYRDWTLSEVMYAIVKESDKFTHCVDSKQIKAFKKALNLWAINYPIHTYKPEYASGEEYNYWEDNNFCAPFNFNWSKSENDITYYLTIPRNWLYKNGLSSIAEIALYQRKEILANIDKFPLYDKDSTWEVHCVA